MKKVILTLLIVILIITCFVGCKKDEVNEVRPTNFICYPIIPNEFTFANELYRRVEVYDIVFPSEKKIVGYLINSEDLEKWKALDNDETIIYATSQERVEYKLYHSYYNSGLKEYDDYELCGSKYYKDIKDRYELYADEDFDEYLTIDYGSINVFKKVNGDESIEA